MEYKDYSILSDSEYLKLAKHYEDAGFNKNIAINKIYTNIENCKTMLMINTFPNNKIKNELKIHLETLTKLSINLELSFNIDKNNNFSFNDFNIYNYLLNLNSVNTLISEYLENETKQNFKVFLNKIKKEINNLINSLLNLLSTLNIKYFKFM